MILITGGAGYIGSALARLCSERGVNYVVLDDLREGKAKNVPGDRLIVGDIGDEALVVDVCRQYGVTAVVHFAASCYVGVSVEHPLEYYENNVRNGVVFVRALTNAGVENIVFSSSCATYGQPDVTLIEESIVQQPVNPYGRTKFVFELLLRDLAAARGMNSIALRYFNAAGADPSGAYGEEHDPETHLIPRALAAVIDQLEPLTLFGDDYPTPDGTCIRDYIHIVDLATAHLRAIELLRQGEKGFAAFNLGTGRGYSVREVVKCIEEVTGITVPLVVAARRPGDPPRLVADPLRAREILGWSATRSDLHTIVEDAWRFTRNQLATREGAR